MLPRFLEECNDEFFSYSKAIPIKNAGDFVPAFCIVFSLIIQRKSFNNIFMDAFRCPLAKLHTSLALHTIADRDDDIQVIIGYFITSVTGLRYICKFCTCTFTVQFSLSINIINMPSNSGCKSYSFSIISQ